MTTERQTTTLRLNAALYRRAKAAAAAEGVTLTSFIEQSLEQRIAGKPVVRREIKLPTFDSGHRYETSPEELKQMILDTDWQGQ